MDTGSAVSGAEIHKLALERLYHEDTLLTHRTYNYLTFNVFLAAVLALGGVSRTSIGIYGYFVAAVGAIVSVLQVAFGRRIEAAIDFWRVYVRVIEEKCKIPMDHLLFTFYSSGEVVTPWGTITKREVGRKAVFKTWPWSWIPSTNTLIGVFLPFVIGSLWFLVTFISLASTGARWRSALVVAAWLCALALTFWPLPASPKRTFLERPNNS